MPEFPSTLNHFLSSLDPDVYLKVQIVLGKGVYSVQLMLQLPTWCLFVNQTKMPCWANVVSLEQDCDSGFNYIPQQSPQPEAFVYNTTRLPAHGQQTQFFIALGASILLLMLLKSNLLLSVGKTFLRDPTWNFTTIPLAILRKDLGFRLNPSGISRTVDPTKPFIPDTLMAAPKGNPLSHLMLVSFTTPHLPICNQLFLLLKIFQNFYFWIFDSMVCWSWLIWAC